MMVFCRIKDVEKRMVKVTDNWFPNYENDMVQVSTELTRQDGVYYGRVSAWGMDDTGVELWREAYNEADALKMYEDMYKLYLSVPDGITIDWFLERGFKMA